MRTSFGVDPKSQLDELIEKLPAGDDIQIGILFSGLSAELGRLLEESGQPYVGGDPTPVTNAERMGMDVKKVRFLINMVNGAREAYGRGNRAKATEILEKGLAQWARPEN